MKKIFGLLALLAALGGSALGQQQNASPSNPVGANISASGSTCANVNVCAWQKLPSTATTTTVTITGTFTATLIIETSADGGITWTQQSSQTAPIVATFTTTSLTDVRVRCSAFTSGIASANIQTAGNQINISTGSSTGGGIIWLTVATLPGSPALNTTDGVTDGNGFSCTVGGGSTRVLCRWNGASWDVVNGDPTASAAVTGAVKTATNGADPNYLVPGLNPSPDVSSTPYGIRCDSATATLDRAQTVRFVAGASVATMPDIGTAGCTAGFVTSLIAGVTITVNRTTSSTFDIYNGTNPPLTGQTTFSLPAGQHATISPSASGTSWIVRFASAVTGASVTSTTPVTVTNPTINTDTQMIELALPASFLNKAGMGYTIRAGGLYSNTVATSPALTFNAKLCTVSGCGSGTVVGLAQIVSGATSATATTNDTWTYSLFAVNNATGATGNLLVKGDPGLTIDLSNVTAAADTIYSDVNTAVSGNIDLTAALFLDFTVAQSVAGASNSYKQLSAMIAPHASPAGAGGANGIVQTPLTTAANTIAPTANGVVPLSLRQTTGTTAHVLDLEDSSGNIVGSVNSGSSNAMTLVIGNSAAPVSSLEQIFGSLYIDQNGSSFGTALVFKGTGDEIQATCNAANTNLCGVLVVPNTATTASFSWTGQGYTNAPNCGVTLLETTAGAVPATGAWAYFTSNALIRVDTTNAAPAATWKFAYTCVGAI